MSQIASTVLAIGLSNAVQAAAETKPMDTAFRQLREEYQAQRALFEAQPLDARRLLQDQAAQIAQALAQRERQIHFTLPEVVTPPPARNRGGAISVPKEFRQQVVAGRLGRLPVKDIRAAVRQRLAQLEQSPHSAVAVSAKLIRYAVVKHMVYDLLPAGKPVIYLLAAGEVIPTGAPADGATGKQFYMPQWVAFEEDRLVVDSVAEAEARIAAMQQYLGTLHLAVSLAPYMHTDEEYQRKRYGMLGQFIHQGRALARYWTTEIIGKIQRKAAAGELNRGLSLSLPYLDDQMLEMRMFDFEVIPYGRTLFVPAFVVLAARREQTRVAQDMRLSHSTRMHLFSGLEALERAFDTCAS